MPNASSCAWRRWRLSSFLRFRCQAVNKAVSTHFKNRASAEAWLLRPRNPAASPLSNFSPDSGDNILQNVVADRGDRIGRAKDLGGRR